MNLYKKLLNIQSKINGLGKDAQSGTGNFGYGYVSGAKVLNFIRPLMNEQGLILKQEILSIDNERQDYQVKSGSKSEILSKVMMKFTWIDTETGEKDENLFGANGQNDWEKGLGSALTYAERYFLLKYFHIPTDEDDIDNDLREKKPPVPAEKPTIETNELLKQIEINPNQETFTKYKEQYKLTKEQLTLLKNKYNEFFPKKNN